MLFSILRNSFCRRPKSVVILLISVTMGASVATAFLGLGGDISRKMALEMRSYGANILVEPLAAEQGGYLNEADLPSIKTVFWRYNITGFAPYLFGLGDVSAGDKKEKAIITGTWFSHSVAPEGEEETVQGVKVIAPWWEVTGGWPQKPDEAILGASLAKRLGVAAGDDLLVAVRGQARKFHVSGIVTTGGYEEEQFFADLGTIQALLGRPGKVSRVLVSALTVPMDEFGKKDPAAMSKEEYEKWYCTAYVTSVAKNVEEVVTGSRAKPIWRIASAEGALLSKLNSLMLLLALLALGATMAAVSSSLMASMTQRSPEIALMKTIGADRLQIVAIFLGETMIIALIGGVAGYIVGDALAGVITKSVFNSTVKSQAWLFPTAIISALVVALAGSVIPLRRVLTIEPVRILKG